MKRIHLFEFEDQPWFPSWLHDCMTRLLPVVHNVVGTTKELPNLVLRALQELKTNEIVNLCSGSGGPMLDVAKSLRDNHHLQVQLTLTDLYPHKEVANRINNQNGTAKYMTEPIDATNVQNKLTGLRTMVGSFHHMTPGSARNILGSAVNDQQGLLIFEISDNRFPKWLWWVALPFNILFCLIITPLARPLTFRQILFTYIVPIIPVCFAWDGAVSNTRTYTLKDVDELIAGIESRNYHWEKGSVGKGMLYVIGLPTQ